MKRNTVIDIALFLLASPVLLVLFVHRCWTHVRFLRRATVPSIECRCGRPVSLVGMWRCSCGFTYRSHALSHW